MVAAVAIALGGCGTTGQNAKAKSLDMLHKDSFEAIIGIWPLTVDEAKPVCGRNNPNSLGVIANGRAYALNGTAQTWEHWADLHEIWAPDPDIPGGYLNESDLLDFVRARC